MRDIIETFSISKDGIDFTVNVVCYNESAMFSDNWEMVNDHQGGVTVKNPGHDRNSYKYAIPLQYTLKERVKDLLSQGVSATEASAQAYKDAQKELQRDIDSSDYGFYVSASIDGVALFNDEILGCSFDYSYHDKESLEEAAIDVFNEHGIIEEALEKAKESAKDILSTTDKLKKLVA